MATFFATDSAQIARGRVVLAHAVRHADKDPMDTVLIPVDPPVQLVIVCCAVSLSKVVVDLVGALR
jgi:hypothetical protein